MKLLQLRALNTNPITQILAHDSRSSKYNKVHTNDILEQFARHGWYEHKRTMVNSVVYAGYQKHMVRLRNEAFKIGDDNLEIVLTNSHNGRSSVVIQCGIYRMVCSNGMIIGEEFAKYRIRHIGFTYSKLNKAIIDAEVQLYRLKDAVCKMKSTKLTEQQKHELRYRCFKTRLEGTSATNINFLKLTLKRQADDRSDLWTYYNRVQEAVIRGGIEYETASYDKDNGRYNFITRKTREVKSVDKIIKLNEQVFKEAFKMVA